MRLRRLEPVLRRALRGPCALPPGSRLIVAASGGADSTALLVGMRRIAPELGLEVCAAHLHHGLRGADADADLAFVRDLCARHAIPLMSARWDTRARMRRRGLSGQAGLRVLRCEFLRACARRAGAAAVATAHTADDQLETLLMRLGRGAGLRGLGGMRPRRGAWIKPMLEATRSDIEADLREAGQPWREDASNRDPSYLRSRIRHEALPALLRALDPGCDPEAARAGLARRAARAADEARAGEQLLDTLARRACARSGRGPETSLDADLICGYPPALKRAILRRFWRVAGAAGVGLPAHRIEALARLLDSGRGGSRVALPEGLEAVREGGRIRIGRPRAATVAGPSPLAVPGRSVCRDLVIEGRWTSGRAARAALGHNPLGDEYFAADGIEGKLEVRPGRADETFVPFGRTRSQRLGRFLSRQHVRHRRSSPTVLADARGILWVIGVRRSARAAITDRTQRALWVHTERHD